MPIAPPNTRFSERPGLSRRARVWLLVVVGVLHVGLGFAIFNGLAASAIILIQDAATAAYSVPLDPPPPPPPTPASPAPTPEPAGKQGAAAKRAKPTPVVAKAPTKAMTAAPAASTGDATRSGAAGGGTGTGGGAMGLGTGGSGSGSGMGSGGSRLVQIAGNITATRDYPARTRDKRLGSSVTIAFTVGTDGRVHACHILKPSPDPEADAITCHLATERFRFRPATDRNGNPIEAPYGWRQDFFVPGSRSRP